MLQTQPSIHNWSIVFDSQGKLRADIKTKRHHQLINQIHLRSALALLTVLKMPLCRYILSQLGQHPEGLNVTELVGLTKIELPSKKKQRSVGFHLILLRKHRLVTYTKDGRYHIYVANHLRISKIATALDHFFNPKLHTA